MVVGGGEGRGGGGRTAIDVIQAEHKVYVSLDADAAALFPMLLCEVAVRGEGEGEVRIQSH